MGDADGLFAVRGLRLVRRAEHTLAEAERSMAPVLARATELIEDLRALSDTARRADQGVRAAIGHAERGIALVRLGTKRRLWPMVAVLAAGRAVAARLRARRAAQRPQGQEITTERLG